MSSSCCRVGIGLAPWFQRPHQRWTCACSRHGSQLWEDKQSLVLYVSTADDSAVMFMTLIGIYITLRQYFIWYVAAMLMRGVFERSIFIADMCEHELAVYLYTTSVYSRLDSRVMNRQNIRMRSTNWMWSGVYPWEELKIEDWRPTSKLHSRCTIKGCLVPS
jgi:hypothetical protein